MVHRYHLMVMHICPLINLGVFHFEAKRTPNLKQTQLPQHCHRWLCRERQHRLVLHLKTLQNLRSHHSRALGNLHNQHGHVNLLGA